MIMANPRHGPRESFQTESIHGTIAYLPIFAYRWMADFYGKLLVECPMDTMGFRNSGNKKPDEFATRQLW